MGGKVYLNYEVTGFSEMTESKGKEELSPILVQSKDKVRLDVTRKFYNALYSSIMRNFFLSCCYITVYPDKICVNVCWFTLGSSSSNDRM